jgi:hypothetical protein
MDKRKDLAMAVGIALLGLLIVVLGSQITLGRIRDPIGSRALPMMTGGLILAGGLFLAGRRLLRWNREPVMIPTEGTPDEPKASASTVRALSVWALCFVYLCLLSTVGFVLLTPLLLVGLLWLMGVRQPVRLGSLSLIAVAVLFGIFGIALHVRLPLGPLDPYLGHIG